MVRSAADATRFTATGPYASSKLGPRSSNIDISGPRRPNETPAEKIARLREASRQAQLSKESRFDRVVSIGRVWADRIHRVTAFTLIAFTGVAAFVTIASTTDMIIYNRRKKRAWYAEQAQKREEALKLAQAAEAEGKASEEQMLLLSEEKAKPAASSEKKGVLSKIKDLFYSDLSTEDRGAVAARAIKNGMEKDSEPETSLGGNTQEAGEGLGILHAIEEAQKRKQQVQDPRSGGSLDRLGEAASTAARDTSREWKDWLTGR